MKIVKKSIPTNIYGINAEYWCLVEFSVNILAKWAHMLWHGYNNPELMGDPVATFVLDFDAADFPPETNYVIDYCISLLLANDKFLDAEVIDAQLPNEL
jgi:hypothetical protein